MDNIYKKMLQATERIEKVKKTLKVEISKTNSYQAVSEGAVLSAVKPIESELGIYSYPISRKVIDTNILTTTSEYNGEKKEKTQLFMRLETIYRFINIDDPNEYIDITTYGDGIDSGDKAPGKAMTYADKYALLKAYKIETGEDPDAKPSEEIKDYKSNNTATEKQITLLKKIVREDKILEVFGTDDLSKITREQASEVISKAMELKNNKLGEE